MENISCKTNEIPAAQAVLELINIKGAVITCDAMNTQKATMAAIAGQRRGGDYVAALKKNHQLFYDEVESYFSIEKKKEIKKNKIFYQTFTNYCFAESPAYPTLEIRRKNQDIKHFPHQQKLMIQCQGPVAANHRVFSQ